MGRPPGGSGGPPVPLAIISRSYHRAADAEAGARGRRLIGFDDMRLAPEVFVSAAARSSSNWSIDPRRGGSAAEHVDQEGRGCGVPVKIVPTARFMTINSMPPATVVSPTSAAIGRPNALISP